MYVKSPQRSPSFGTGLVQRIPGLGLYMMTPDRSPSYGTALVQRIKGLGCSGSDCNCGCNKGLGIFDGGLDFKTWGALEWGAVLVGIFAVGSMFSTTKRAVGSARRSVRSRAAKSRRRKQLQEELARL